MLNANSNTTYAEKCEIVYSEYNDNVVDLKSQKAINNFGFTIGDELKYTCYSEIGERTIIDKPTGNQTYTFHYAGNPCPGISTITDIDGNTYNTVQIGTQCWMAENLKTTTYNNGTAIPNVTGYGAWENLTSGAYVWYDNDITWKNSYGALYNWFATINANGLCPTGWHVPTNDEWTALTDYIGGTSSPHGNKLKSCRRVNSPLGGGCNTSEHPRWDQYYNTHYGTNDYGFSGLPGGLRSYSIFDGVGDSGLWWASTEASSVTAWNRSLFYDFGSVPVYSSSKQGGFSVCCLRDN